MNIIKNIVRTKHNSQYSKWREKCESRHFSPLQTLSTVDNESATKPPAASLPAKPKFTKELFFYQRTHQYFGSISFLLPFYSFLLYLYFKYNKVYVDITKYKTKQTRRVFLSYSKEDLNSYLEKYTRKANRFLAMNLVL